MAFIRSEILPGRASIPGNLKSSPYNAALSRRLSAHPGRLFRGGLQTCRDLQKLAKSIRNVSNPAFSSVLAQESRIHFLGYSTGGYVALVLLLSDAEGIFRESRCALFASCADRKGVDLSSILILDDEAARRLLDYYGEEALMGDGDPEVRDWLINPPEGV